MFIKFITGLAWSVGALFLLNLAANLFSDVKTAKERASEISGSLIFLSICGAWLLARYCL